MTTTILLNETPVQDRVGGYTLTRTNDLTGGSVLNGSITLLTHPDDDYKRCQRVEFVELGVVLQINGFTQQSDGFTVLNLVQVGELYHARQPVFSRSQLSDNKPKTRSAIISDILSDFGISHSTPSIGDLQYDLVGEVDSDPVSVVTGVAAAAGFVTYITPTNTGVRFKSYQGLVTTQAVVTTNHVVEFAGITPPELDRVVVVATTKTVKPNSLKPQTTIEESRSVFGTLEERTTSTIDPKTGDEESETICMMKLIRPDTHPKDAQMVMKETSSKKVYSDSQGRISGYVLEVNRNEAMLSQESKNSQLIKAERVEYSADFNSTTGELSSTTETTYQAHVVGRLQLVVFKPGGLERKKVDPPKRLSNEDGALTEAEENSQYITPLVLTKRVRVSYNKVGTNSWREKITVAERQFVSKTSKTNGAKNETQEVRVLGGMKVTQNSSRLIDSVPLVQTLPTAEDETEDETHTITLYGDTVPSVCSSKRTERVELSGVVSAAYHHNAAKLIAIPKLNKRLACSFIVTPDSTKLVAEPYSKLATADYNWLAQDVTLEFKAGVGTQLAGTFVVLSNATRTIEPHVIPPPVIVGNRPHQVPTLIDSVPLIGGAVAKPLIPIGTVSINTVAEDDDYWYVDEITAVNQPTVNGQTWVVGTTPPTAVPESTIANDTIAQYDYESQSTAYFYLGETTVIEEISYESFVTAFSYSYR